MAGFSIFRAPAVTMAVIAIMILPWHRSKCDDQTLSVEMQKDAYSVHLGNQIILSGKGVAVRNEGTWLSSEATGDEGETLSMASQTEIKGHDTVGDFTGTVTVWNGENGVQLTTTTKQYSAEMNGSVVGFSYAISGKALTGTNTENATDVITNFPALSLAANSIFSPDNTAYLSWQGTFINPQRSTHSGFGTTSGPHVYLTNNSPVDTADVIVLSYFDHFMSSSQTNTKYNGESVDWLPGISQSVTGLPKGFSQGFLIYHGKQGLTSAMYEWGKIMQASHSSPGIFQRSPDITLEKIGYQTDNGAMYCFCSKDCVNTLLQEKEYLDKEGLKIGYLSHQGDWWIAGGGAPWCVSEWEPNRRYDAMSVAEFQQKLGVPIQLYAPYFCNDTKYATINGGNFSMVESNSSLQGCGIFKFRDAAPEASYNFYRWLFQFGKTMGMVSFEPDFLNQNYNCMPAFRESPAGVEQWMSGMNQAGKELGIPLQWCMATPTNVLASLDLPMVTNFRASDDYYYGGSYNIGLSSLLIWSVGAAPSKDTFWSTDNAPLGPEMGGCDRKRGCPMDHNNASCELHTILTVLSTGPVGFSDAIGKSNISLLMRTCRQDGVLLKPAKAITAVDATLTANRAPKGNVYTTFCGQGADQPAAAFLFVSFSLTSPWTVAAADLWPHITTHSAQMQTEGNRHHVESSISLSFVYRLRWNSPVCKDKEPAFSCVSFTSVDQNSNKLNASAASFIELPARESANTSLTPCLTTVWPVRCTHGWVLLGELGKYVPLAVQRFPYMYKCASNGIFFDVVGTAGEVVPVTALSPSSSGRPTSVVVVVDVTIPASGRVTISLPQ